MTAGELVYLITADDSKLNSSLSKSEKGVKSWGNKLSSWTVAKGQMIANSATKTVSQVAGVAKEFIKNTVNAVAENEQLIGGIETLFKDTAPQVLKFASNAYKTAGISANKYMETVTSFSASLLQSLGNDTDKAADYADMAIADMSDNANKMGSSMESIQNAYQGFAKQNYTMLDNLKLGYGGTKKEMERLLQDAGKIVGKKFDIKSLADVYEAIHVIQQELDITGTTQKEAENTISGSFNSAKAAWQDLLVAVGSGKDVKKAFKNFSDSAKTALRNVAPVVRRAVENIPELVKELLPEVGNIINEIGRGLFGKDWDITIEWVQKAWGDVQSAIDTVSEWIANAQIAIVEWVMNAWTAVNNAIDTVSEWVGKIVEVTVKWITDTWTGIKEAFDIAGEWVGKTVTATVEWVQKAWDDVKNAIAEVGKGIWNNVVNFTLGLWQDITKFIEHLPDVITIPVNFVKRVIGDAQQEVASTVVETVTGSEEMGNVAEEMADMARTYFGWPFAKGNWNVPYDNFPSLLHRGEMVLTKSQARKYRDGEGNMDYSIVGEIIGSAIEHAMGRVNVLLSGDKVGNLTTKRVRNNINAQNAAVVRGMGG